MTFRIIADPYRLLIQHNKAEIAHSWFDQIWAMKKQSKGMRCDI